jgi:scyllo-inositol 2-dehydrogenase (NADP+)
VTDTIRTGVIGFGLSGRIFHAAVISATPGLELAGIVQRKGDEAAKAYPNVQIYRSIEELLADPSIRLIAVGTTSFSHFEVAEQCLRADRDVIIDKPFTLTSEEAAQLIRLARGRGRLLTAYQNRRWDGDFKTVEKILVSGLLGRLVTFESHMDRFRPQPRLKIWQESGGPGSGTLFNLGPHLVDQALTLFGKPDSLFTSVRVDRDDASTDDVFDITLFYPRLTAYLRASTVAKAPGARFTLHGTQGSFVKFGIDPQEDALRSGIGFDTPGFGHDPEEAWGNLYLEGAAPQSVETEAGDYRGIYENVRDALLGKAPLAVQPEQAWRTTRLIEIARESSSQGRVLLVDFSNEP